MPCSSAPALLVLSVLLLGTSCSFFLFGLWLGSTKWTREILHQLIDAEKNNRT